MRKILMIAVCAALALSGCSDGDATAHVPATTSTTTVAPVSAGEGAEAAAITEDDLVTFVAAVETAITGTAHEGALYASPETYIAAAQLFCARLGAGDDVESIVDDYLADLSGSSLDASSPDDTRLVGAILGAGTETLCPQHSDST